MTNLASCPISPSFKSEVFKLLLTVTLRNVFYITGHIYLKLKITACKAFHSFPFPSIPFQSVLFERVLFAATAMGGPLPVV